MSKIAKKPIVLKEGINIDLKEGIVKVVGPKGELSYKISQGVNVEIDGNNLWVSQDRTTDKKTGALLGLTHALIANMVKGVESGFEKKLELSGVGYRAQVSGDTLTLSLGFSHPVVFKAPQDINFAVSEGIITVSGLDKGLVGNVASKIRDVRPPEPYKGKGIKYQNEKIRRKAGKAAKAVGAK
jgi:large subunit ribosomal protein L6